eukprot:569035-Rhodomonas_salina.1
MHSSPLNDGPEPVPMSPFKNARPNPRSDKSLIATLSKPPRWSQRMWSSRVVRSSVITGLIAAVIVTAFPREKHPTTPALIKARCSRRSATSSCEVQTRTLFAPVLSVDSHFMTHGLRDGKPLRLVTKKTRWNGEQVVYLANLLIYASTQEELPAPLPSSCFESGARSCLYIVGGSRSSPPLLSLSASPSFFKSNSLLSLLRALSFSLSLSVRRTSSFIHPVTQPTSNAPDSGSAPRLT